MENSQIAYTKNGQDLGLAFDIPENLRKQPFFPAVVLKNAEMSFNFGAEPFKHEPVEGHVGFVQAPPESVVENAKAGSGAPQRKIVANAPQAIIIEVLFHSLCCWCHEGKNAFAF